MSDDVFGAGDGGIPGVRDAAKHPTEEHSTGHHTPTKNYPVPHLRNSTPSQGKTLLLKKRFRLLEYCLATLSLSLSKCELLIVVKISL